MRFGPTDPARRLDRRRARDGFGFRLDANTGARNPVPFRRGVSRRTKTRPERTSRGLSTSVFWYFYFVIFEAIEDRYFSFRRFVLFLNFDFFFFVHAIVRIHRKRHEKDGGEVRFTRSSRSRRRRGRDAATGGRRRRRRPAVVRRRCRTRRPRSRRPRTSGAW